MDFHQSKLYIQDIDRALKHVIGIEKIFNKSVLVTGATGTIGSFVADMLIRFNQQNKANISLYLAGRNLQRLQKQFGYYDNVNFLQYDMMKPIEFDVSIDYIIHAAGNAHPAAFNGNPVETIIGNIESTFRLLEYLREHHGKRFLYVSSGEVYGQGDVSLDSFEEDYVGYVNVLASRSCYPLSKRTTENLCGSYYKQYEIETVIVRPCHTYGPCMTETDNRAHVQFFHNALAGENIVLKSAGNQMRSYNYVGDCASALLTVLINGVPGEAYNLANPESRLTIAQLADKIASAGGQRVIFEDPSSGDIANQSPIAKQVLNTQKIEKLGWIPAFNIEEGIVHTLNILKDM